MEVVAFNVVERMQHRTLASAGHSPACAGRRGRSGFTRGAGAAGGRTSSRLAILANVFMSSMESRASPRSESTLLMRLMMGLLGGPLGRMESTTRRTVSAEEFGSAIHSPIERCGFSDEGVFAGP